jgi:hypothetical protein
MYMLNHGRHTTVFIIILLHSSWKISSPSSSSPAHSKNKLTMWLCLVEGNLTSLHDLVSFKIDQLKGSRMRRVTKENAIDRPSLELVQLLPFIKDQTFATKDVKVTQLGGCTVHQLVESFLLMHPKVNPV